MEPTAQSAYRPPIYVLPVIVLAQFCGTSLWFAPNGVMEPLIAAYGLSEQALGHLTAAVQLGFIGGTLVFALLTLADRFSPSRLFLVCALLGALCNAGMVLPGQTLPSLLLLRLATGFFLAGIYPVGMKIASDYYREGLGTSLGYLVGALVLGTALPHLLRWGQFSPAWETVVGITSGLAAVGGMCIAFLPDGPYHKPMPVLDTKTMMRVFQNREFQAAAFGYFGHMWELYTLWAFVPVLLAMHPEAGSQGFISLWSFLILAIGGPACVLAGYLARVRGEKNVARLALIASGVCCLLVPFALAWDLPYFLAFLLFWGAVVIADSPLFSTLVARNAPPDSKGTALTVVTSVGFAITILSLESLSALRTLWEGPAGFSLLVLGPVLGVFALWRSVK
ncbi:MFS transporter [Robiginitalea sediminis]|uniref:MFS transporter n=1 Tax=Robiginitalea sediminis TaxID=1982593 RepID=UPI000B4BE0DC|nr:MFS transporter [Robiginitalea sediminis]